MFYARGYWEVNSCVVGSVDGYCSRPVREDESALLSAAFRPDPSLLLQRRTKSPAIDHYLPYSIRVFIVD